MTKQGKVSLPLALFLAAGFWFSSEAESPRKVPDFKEVYDVVHQHLAEMSDSELNRIAVEALLSALSPRVALVGAPASGSSKDSVLVSKTGLFDGPVGYVRVSRVGEGLDKGLRQALEEIGSSNKLSGLIIDLRFAAGTNYAAAAATADLFTAKQLPLLDWGQGLVRSREKPESISAPLAVLVNRQTAGAAEALAAVLREIGVGLILGTRTAGQAMITQEFLLKDGERLRIATAPIQLGDGSSLSAQGLKPDIAVEVAVEDERAYFGDAYKEPSRQGPTPGAGLASTNLVSGTNRTRRPRFNEAELVRERREGFAPSTDSSGVGSGDSDKPVVHDPVLARALDFLKGLTVMRQTRS